MAPLIELDAGPPRGKKNSNAIDKLLFGSNSDTDDNDDDHDDAAYSTTYPPEIPQSDNDDDDNDEYSVELLLNDKNEHFNRLFSKWDADASGDLDMTEVMDGVKNLCQSQDMAQHVDDTMISALFRTVDCDQNQVLDAMEFSVLLKQVASQLGVETEDLVTIANSSSDFSCWDENDNADLEHAGKAFVLLPHHQQRTNPFMALLRKSKERWVALSTRQRECVQQIIVRTVGNRRLEQRKATSSASNVEGDDEFIDCLEDKADAMWVPLEVLVSRVDEPTVSQQLGGPPSSESV